MEEKQESYELPKARTVSERPSVRSAVIRSSCRLKAFIWRPLRWVGGLLWRKSVLFGLVIALIVSAAVGGASYGIWKNWYWLPQESRLAGDAMVTPIKTSSSEVSNDTGECWILHGRQGRLVTTNDTDGLVVIRYMRLSDDTDMAPEKKLVVSYDNNDVRHISFETREQPIHCPAGTLFVLEEDEWRDMPDEYGYVQKGIGAYSIKQERMKRMIDRALSQD